LLGIPGGTGSILVSRLSTAWHLATSAVRDATLPGAAGGFIRRPHHEPSLRVVMLVLLLVALPVGLVYFLVLRLFAWLAAAFAFSMLALFFLCIAVSHALLLILLTATDVLQIIVSLVVAYYVTNYLASHGYDPDMYAMPIHSAIMDLMGQLMLVTSFELASALGLHVRSHLRSTAQRS
jgi:solute carrier family 41